MALANRPKPKVQHRKRQAMHHKRTHAYMKTYWPYLPVLGIFGLGALLNKTVNDAVLFDSTANAGSLGYPTRIEAMAGPQAGWTLIAVILIAGAAMATWLAMHWFRIQRALNRGEQFAAKHPWWDIGLAFLVTAGVLLTRRAVSS